MVSIPARRPICHKAMAGKIKIFTRASIAIAAIEIAIAAITKIQFCHRWASMHQHPQRPNS